MHCAITCSLSVLCRGLHEKAKEEEKDFHRALVKLMPRVEKLLVSAAL